MLSIVLSNLLACFDTLQLLRKLKAQAGSMSTMAAHFQMVLDPSHMWLDSTEADQGCSSSALAGKYTP